MVLNLSGTGLFVQTNASAQPGDPVELTLGGSIPVTGEVVWRRQVAPMLRSVAEGGVGVRIRNAPEAYYLLPEAADAIERLQAHGVRTEPAPVGRQMRVEAFVIDSTTAAARPFQGRNERTVFGAWEAAMMTGPEGTIAVPMDQPLARLAFTLLEARSDDGFANWAILDTSIEEGWYPIWRLPPGS